MRFALVLSLMAGCCCVSVAQARAEGLSPLDWLGLGHKSPPARTSNVSSTTKTTPMFAKMTDGTRRLVSNTRNLFTPKKKAKPPVKKRGVTATYHREGDRPRPSKPTFFERLFGSEPPPPPRTVDEWMSLEQIRP